MNKEEKFKQSAKQIYGLMMTLFMLFLVFWSMLIYYMIDPSLSAFRSSDEEYVAVEKIEEISEDDYDKIENGIHVRTGFVEGEGLMLVVNNCTNCHSAKLVTQNRMSKESWLTTIRWMQETQNLWDLGKNEEPIINYLATYYSPTKKGRRQNLANIKWYELEN